MWRTAVFLFAIFACSFAEQTEKYNVTIVTPAQASVGSRIIGGTITTIEQYPFAVQILVNNQLQCGGSLVTLRHVLSAGHCFFDSAQANLLPPSIVTIRAGTTNLNSGGSLVRVSTIVVHEWYNRLTYDNDVAVVVLASRLTASARIGTVAIPSMGFHVPDNQIVVHAGWGNTIPGVPSASPVLQHVSVYTINRYLCASRYQEIQVAPGQYATVTYNMMCAGLLDVGGRDACQGDSGGPLLYNNILVGITSWGYGCAEPRYPGVSARVSAYTNWINSTIARNNARPHVESVSLLTLASLAVCLLLSTKQDIS